MYKCEMQKCHVHLFYILIFSFSHLWNALQKVLAQLQRNPQFVLLVDVWSICNMNQVC
jgi:hypothetical protein